MFKKVLFINSLILCICSSYIFPQSEIPSGVDNYFQVISRVNLGGRDLTNVVFYEVPDTITVPLYFAIKDPEGNNSAPDQGNFNINTTYTLVGGPGTLSDAASKQDVYAVPAVNHLKGTILAEYIYNNTFVAVQGENPENNDDWVYFPGVLPQQGEHIGNKYYFKIAAECALDAGNIFINGYKLNVSLDNGLGKNPTGVSGVRAFSYSWMICLNNNPPVTLWNMYPFVPDNATDDIEFNSFDMDGQESSVAYAVNRTIFEAVPSSGDNVTATRPITINPTTDYRNGTWRLTITEGNAGPIMLNTAEFWFTNSVSNEIYRAYADEFTLATADHIAVNAADRTAITGGTDSETITLQVVDSSGNPLPYSRMIYVEILGTAVINNRNGTPIPETGATYVTTDSTGLGTVRVIKNNPGTELVTIRVWTNGDVDEGNDGNEAILPELSANESVDILFVDNLLPVISSAFNLTFTEGNPSALQDITITDSGTVDITSAGDIRIKIPESINAVFNPIAVIPTVSGAGAVDPVQYEAGNTIAFFQVTGAFNITDTIEISGLALTGVNSVSSGYLEASFDNGATYNVTDNKFIRILSSTPTYVWDGSTSTVWNEITNWVNDEMPNVDTDNVIIPDVTPNFMPTITNAHETINNLTIDTGATLTLGSDNFTISGSVSNNGNLITNGYNVTIGGDVVGTGAIDSTGGGTITIGGDWDIRTFSPGSGTVVFNGTSDSYITSHGQSFNNITINKTGATATLGDAININGNIVITAGTFDVSPDNYPVTIAGDWNSTGTFEPRNGTIYFNGTSTLQSAETFYNCTINDTGSLRLNGNDLTVSNLFDIIGSGILYRTGNETAPTDINSGTVIYQGAAGGQIQDYAGSPGNDYNNLEIGGPGIFTIVPGSELTIAHILSVSAGTLSATGAANIRAQGDVTFSGTGSFTKGTGIFYFDGGSGKILLANNQDLGNVTIANTPGNGVTLQDNAGTDLFTLAGANAACTIDTNCSITTSNDTVTVTGGTLSLNDNATITTGTGNISSTGTINNNGAFSCNGFSSTGIFNNTGDNTITAGGNVILSGSFTGIPAHNNVITMTGNGTAINAGYTIDNLIADVSGAGGTISITANDLTLAGYLTIAADTSFNIDSQILSLAGNLTCAGDLNATLDGSINAGANVNFNGGSYQNGAGIFHLMGGTGQTIFPPADNLGAVEINTDNTVVTLSAGLICTTLTLSLNTELITGNNNLVVNGNLTCEGTITPAAGTITARGNVDFTNGSFQKGSGIFTFEGGTTKNFYGNGQDFGRVTIANTLNNVTIIQTDTTMDTLAIQGGNARVEINRAIQSVGLTINDGGNINNSGTLGITGGGMNNATIRSSGPGTFSYTGNGIDFNGNDLHLGGLNTYDPGVILGAQEGIIIDASSTFNNQITLNDPTAEFTVSAGQIAATTDDDITVINGTVTLQAGSTLNIGTGDLSCAGTISSQGNIVCYDVTFTGTFDNPGINTIEANGNVSLSGTFQGTPANNTLTMLRSGTTLDAAYQIGNLRLPTSVAGTITIANNDLDCAGTVTIEANATLDLDAHDLTTRGTLICQGTLDADQDETLNARGNVSFVNGNFMRGIPTTGIFLFQGANTKNLYPFNQYLGPVTLEPTVNNNVTMYQDATMDTLTIGTNAIFSLSGSSESVTLTINDGCMVNNSGSFRILNDINMLYLYSTPGGTFDFTGNDINYNGNRINLGMLASYEPEINLGADEEIFIDAPCHFDNNIFINGNNALFTINAAQVLTTADNTITITNGSLTLHDNAILDTGTGALSNGDTINNNGSIICGNFSSTATYTNSGDNSIQAHGDVIIDGLFSAPLTDNTLILSGNPGTIDAVPQIGHLEVNAPGGTVGIINHDLSLAGSLLVTDTTLFDMTNQDLLVTGTATIHGTLDFSNNGIQLNLMNQLLCDGIINATGSGNINAYGNINLTGGTFNAGSGTLFLTGGGLQEITSDTQNPGSIHITTDNTEIRLLDNLTCDSLTIDLNTFLDINGNSLNLSAANFANNGILYRTGAGGESAPPDNDSGVVAYRGAAGGTIQQYGGVDDYYILNILGSGTFSLTGTTQVTLDLEITGGTFSLGGHTLSIERNFSHDSMTSTFSHSNGEVLFINNTIESAVTGDNEFFNFTCNTPGKIIRFVTNQRQTIVPGGTFFIHGTEGNEIRLLETIDIEDNNRWIMDARVGCTINIQHVIVEDSFANPEPIIVPDFVLILNCVNWVRYAFVEESWTEDTDSNGKIDRIGVEVMNNLSLNDNFTNLIIRIPGYELTDNPFTTGDNPVDEYDDIFYIRIVEKSELDTGATPVWWIESTNHSLMDNLTETRIVSSIPEADGGEIADDRAIPLIGYTLSIADKDEIFVCFSEPIHSPGGGEITVLDFPGYSGSASISEINRITTQGSGTKEVLLLLSANVTADEIVNEAFITTTVLEDKAGLALVSQSHRVTDIGLGLTHYGIIEPIWAQDETVSVPDNDGIGYISLFDDTEWLQDQNITLQTRIHDDLPGAGIDISLYFDINVPENSLNNNLWLPPFDTSEYNGIVPIGNESARELSVLPENIVSDQLRNFIIPHDDSEIKNDARVEFLLEIPLIQLYCARVSNPDSAQWYRTICPWAFRIHDIISQKSNVTILNNVINPTRGERTHLHYILPKAGKVTITVFDLAGDIIDILYKGRQSKGEYSIDWNGRNRGARIVARGIYFIKIVAPGIEEIRKVLIVK
ncbi:MAG: hypothetical protein JXJ04_02365 [Spirochaetales bacterium]|nr:hypothetical protein [Spirochaetales bacterium]